MPEVHLPIAWPGNKRDELYSPSTIIHQYLSSGDEMPLPEFETKVRAALTSASARVKEKFGFECTSAQAEMERIQTIINQIPDRTATVRIL